MKLSRGEENRLLAACFNKQLESGYISGFSEERLEEITIHGRPLTNNEKRLLLLSPFARSQLLRKHKEAKHSTQQSARQYTNRLFLKKHRIRIGIAAAAMISIAIFVTLYMQEVLKFHHHNYFSTVENSLDHKRVEKTSNIRDGQIISDSKLQEEWNTIQHKFEAILKLHRIQLATLSEQKEALAHNHHIFQAQKEAIVEDEAFSTAETFSQVKNLAQSTTKAFR